MRTPVVLIFCLASVALADDFKTVDGKEYKNVKVKRVEPDGIVLSTSYGISKVYFTELPKDVQERFHYDHAKAAAYSAQQNQNLEVLQKQQEEAKRKPSSPAAIDSQGPAALMSQAESALRANQFSQGAELLNRIVSEYPISPQAKTVRSLLSSLRDKETTKDGPLTTSEAQRLRRVMDALASIKINYRTATPEKRQAMEALLGAETLRDTDNGLGSISSSGTNLRDAMESTTPAPTHSGTMATSGIENLPTITPQLHDEILNALKMTDKLDGLYKGGCSSAEFIAAAVPIEGVFMNLQAKLPEGDPRRDLLANSFEAYQQTAIAMKAYEQGRGQRPDATFGAAGIRKGLLTKILEGNLTPAERNVYNAWRKAVDSGP